ncbi:Flagellar hook-associated 2 domain protein [Candidatus Propionivibrio aalborgensis]|uniref:Flagellar hook-associated protein 2 n=1 Tax=Candidatus Propionivibrio aalborgensis TaxID=1860101 RepID=A0A1A8XHL3_9RHOO|nr:flagellar filament capping protein FliD [Candidatus Propionivibrio aalborgensis]SBT04674.1 Flagellar hook-associated 2 domain protein [Candidatus Propionivibrio aalborgensis]
MAISSPGLGSNLDVNSIVSQLMSIEQRPLTLLKAKEAAYQTKITALGSLKGAISALQTTATALVPTTGTTALQKFSAFNATLADTSIATATTSSGAVAGSYSLSNIVLASAQQIRKSGITVPADAGTLSIQVGTEAAVNVNIAAGSTLADVSTAINNAASGISASIINDGTTEHLVLTANDTGSANTITITGSDVGSGTGWAGGPFDYTGTGPNNGWTESVVAGSATLDINGIPVTSASNTLSSTISGVTLNLLKAGSTTLTVTRDTSSLSTAVNAFVKAYNDFNATATTLGSYNAATKVAGTLNGDSTLRSAQNQLRTLIGTIPSEVDGEALQRLSDIGVSLKKDGTLAVDSSKLSSLISSDINGVANLVAAYGSAFKTTTDGLIGTGGTLSARTDGLNASIKSITQQEEVVAKRLTQIEARYRRQFTALDTLISGLSQTSSFLTQQLANLPTISST